MNDRMNFLERISGLSPKRLALLAAELNDRVERLERRVAEPIAVIGMGCRFPGGSNDPDSFWRLLVEGVDAIIEVPPDRWDVDALYDSDPEAPGKVNTRWGGFLNAIDQFDPEFFGISPREAAGMDPQQRMLLEVTWEALENAGICPERLAGSRTGVFVGLCSTDYYLKQFEAGLDSVDAHVATGNAHSVASGRISYLLGLQGPSLSVDTACSSSLVAVHLACQSLRAGECRTALAGGVNLVLMPDTTILLSKAHMLSPNGRCKTFDASADGFVRSEGCGVIVLKRLADAQADGDPILAVIRGTACNQDGRSNGLTAPNGPSQVAVIREALTNAGLPPGDVDYIEAHGTGTSLGDPIEAHALAEVFGPGRRPDNPLKVGSVKTNFGHAESAAGIAGLIKTVLAIQHQTIPPSLHLRSLNPHIDWNGVAISVPTKATSWNPERGQRVAGVSSFGFSGTNAHVVLSDPTGPEISSHTSAQNALALAGEPSTHLLLLSAKSESALSELADRYEQLFRQKHDLELANISRSAATGRSHFDHRLAVLAGNLSEARERLISFRSGQGIAGIKNGRSPKSGAPGVVFMFTGQGSQYPGMGRDLFQAQPVFRRELEKCAEILNPFLEIPLLEMLFSDGSKPRAQRSDQPLDQTRYTQPALFALEYALAAMWRSWGVEPVAVLGHSVGEYVAACVAGVFSLEDALRLVAERGRLMGSLPSAGAMAAVFADESRVFQAIQAQGNHVSIACVNGPANVVVSGRSAAVDRLLLALKREGVLSQSLTVSHAFHSESMNPILDSFQTVAASVHFSEPLLPIASNVTGTVAAPNLMSAPEYWVRQIRNPVRFADSIRALREVGHTVFLEIGPHPVLTGMARASAPEAGIVWAASLNRKQQDWESLLEAVSALYVHGVNFDWDHLLASPSGKRVSLPTYPFQRSRFWLQQSSVAIAAATSEDENWLYRVEWRSQKVPEAKPAAGATGSAEFIPPLSLLAETASQELPAVATAEILSRYDQLTRQLEALSGEFINRAFLRLGWSFSPGDVFTTQEFAEQLAIVPGQRRLFERLLGILVEESILTSEGERWSVRKRPESRFSDLQLEAHRLEEQFPEYSGPITFTARCADRLDEVLRGICDPLQLLFPGGNFDTANDLYRHSPLAQALNTVARKVLVAAIQKASENRPIRILEIGAGTGGTTSFLLPSLPAERTRYVFSDISPLFLSRARAEFRNYPFVKFQLLDVEKPPREQGFQEETFDVIVAANAIHATRDLRESVGHMRDLLAPGGLLILVEATGRKRWIDLTFGMTAGWWRFADANLRSNYPLMPAEKWKALFTDIGLQTVPATATSSGNIEAVQHAILLGRKPLTIDDETSAKAPPGFWIILCDVQGIGEQLADLISHRGQESVLVLQSEEYQFGSAPRATVNPLRQADFNRLLLDASAHYQAPLQGVLNLWPMDEKLGSETTVAQWEAAQQRVGGGLLHAAQALLGSAAISGDARIWLATCGGQGVLSNCDSRGEVCQPIQGLAWGLGRVVCFEHPSLFGAMIDLDPEASAEASAATIWREIEHAGEQDAVAYRSGERLVPRLVRAQEPAAQPLKLRREGSYLITGGLGGLGLLVAEWMAAQGAGHVVLLSRREFPDRSLWSNLPADDPHYRGIEAIIKAEKLGTRITVARGDVADETAVRFVLDRLAAEGSPLRGIAHCAMEMTGRSISDLDLLAFQRMCRAKAVGAWVLNRLTLGMELDFFVLFSSLAGVLGAASLGHYAAANQALDMLAHWRRERGLTALCVNWGRWERLHFATEMDKEEFERAGLHPMRNDRALAALGQLISNDRTSAVVASVDWDALRGVYEAGRARPLVSVDWDTLRGMRKTRPLPSEIPYLTQSGDRGAATQKKPVPPESDFAVELQSAFPARRRDLLTAHLRALVADVLGFDASREIDLEQGLFELGMDSLVSVDLKGRLERTLGLQLPSTLTFNYPNIRALTDYILCEALKFAPESKTEMSEPRVDPTKTPSSSQPVDDLSEEEIAHLLLKKLQEIK